jgi:hypothetical protein
MDTDKIAELFQRHIEGREQLLEQQKEINDKMAQLCVSHERQIAQLEQSLNDLRTIQAQESDRLSKRIEIHEKRIDKHAASIIKLEDLEEEHETQRIEHIDITQSHEDRLAKLEPYRHNKNVSPIIHTCHSNPSDMTVIYHCNDCGNDFDASGDEIQQLPSDCKHAPVKPDYADLLVHMMHILESVYHTGKRPAYSDFFFAEISEVLEQVKPIVATFDTPEPEQTETKVEELHICAFPVCWKLASHFGGIYWYCEDHWQYLGSPIPREEVEQ